MTDTFRKPAPLTPAVVKSMGALTVDSQKKTKTKQPRAGEHKIPLRPTPKTPAKPSTPSAAKRQPTIANTTTAAKPGRKRLVDVLAEQAESSQDEDEHEAAGPSQRRQRSAQRTPPRETVPDVLAQSPAPPVMESPHPKGMARPGGAPKKRGPKFTYSQRRTMLTDDPLMDGIGSAGADDFESQMMSLSQPLLPPPEPDVFDEGLDDDPNATGAIRSLHELRQAGANSRFADEMEDILDRVGVPTPKPSSARRNALLELAQKMPQKSFRQQFRSHSVDGTLFNRLDRERDVIAGFAIVSILVTLCSATMPAHLLAQLRSQGVASLVECMLSQEADIGSICKDRKTNMSKIGQSTVVSVKSAMLALSVWGPVPPEALSPRTIALKCLELLCRQGGDAGDKDDIMSPAVTEQLFSVLSAAREPDYWASSSGEGRGPSPDLSIALSMLETHAVKVMQARQDLKWKDTYLPVVADVLAMAIRHGPDAFGEVELSVLKLTINMTNNNPEATTVFVDKGLLQALAEAACGTFEVVLKSITDDAFVSGVLDTLVLMLGVMINFSEDDPLAGRNLHDDQGRPTAALDRLIRVFLDHHAVTSEVWAPRTIPFHREASAARRY